MDTVIRPRTPMTVAISASKNPDLRAFGLSVRHLKDAMADLAIQVLAGDMDLAYGGDLREHGLTRLLFELVARYTSPEDLGVRTRVTNHLAWPVHIGMPVEKIEHLISELRGAAEISMIGIDGGELTLKMRRGLRTRTPIAEEWVKGLTAMRRFQHSRIDARIVLGGRVTGYMGCMPGVAEEALLSISGRQPLFLVGGFGGAARDVAETLGLAQRWTGSRRDLPWHSEFRKWTGGDLNNGLSREENEMLATTSFLGQIIVLILRGLNRMKRKRVNKETELLSHA